MKHEQLRCVPVYFSFFASSSISFFFAASLYLSSRYLTGNLPSELGKLSELSEYFNWCVTRACRSATIARTTSLCSSACHSLPDVYPFLSFAQLFCIYRAATWPETCLVSSELGNMSELSECFICVTHACRSATIARTTSVCSSASYSLPDVYPFLLSTQHLWIWRAAHSPETCLANLATCQNWVSALIASLVLAALQLVEQTTLLCSSASHSMPVCPFLSSTQCWKAPNLLGSNCETKVSFIYSSRCFTCFSSTPTWEHLFVWMES
jgi:hypothetical protein